MALSIDGVTQVNLWMYEHIMKGHRYPKWGGSSILKLPEDLIAYQQIIFQNKPDFIIETGTKYGGSARFFADMCELNGRGHVVTIDISPKVRPPHKRLTYLTGNSIDRKIVNKVKEIVGNGTVMVVLDSKHTDNHVRWELFHYSKVVTPGQFIVVEDCYNGNMSVSGVRNARDWFLRRTSRFKLVDIIGQFVVGVTRDGWIKRLR